MVLASGTPAPSFKLVRGDFEEFTEKSLSGQGTVLVFYPFAFADVAKDIQQAHTAP